MLPVELPVRTPFQYQVEKLCNVVLADCKQPTIHTKSSTREILYDQAETCFVINYCHAEALRKTNLLCDPPLSACTKRTCHQGILERDTGVNIDIDNVFVAHHMLSLSSCCVLINGLSFEVAILRHVRRRFFCDVGCAPPIIVFFVVRSLGKVLGSRRGAWL